MKKPRALMDSGFALRGVGGGRGLAARDAVCVDLIIAISDLVVQYFFGDRRAAVAHVVCFAKDPWDGVEQSFV
jgi:hypothetical protein